MTIGGWVLCFLALAGVIFTGVVIISECTTTKATVIVVVAMILIGILIFSLGFWYFHNTASGIRALTDQKSNLNNGIERIIRVYTADGRVIAEYKGTIDLEMNRDYIKFDWQGKRYIYYNCFVETIATIP